MISLHFSYLGFTIIFLVVTELCLNFIQLYVVFVSISMFSHNNSYSQVKIIKCFYFELFIGNGIYREQPWGFGLSLRFKPKNRPAGMGSLSLSSTFRPGSAIDGSDQSVVDQHFKKCTLL